MNSSGDMRTKPLPACDAVNVDRADDIKDLFEKFGAEPGRYQEIGKENRAAAAQLRWPILASLNIAPTAPVPAAAIAAATSIAIAGIRTRVADEDGPRPMQSPNFMQVPVGLAASPPESAALPLSVLFQRLAEESPSSVTAAIPLPTLKTSVLFNRGGV